MQLVSREGEARTAAVAGAGSPGACTQLTTHWPATPAGLSTARQSGKVVGSQAQSAVLQFCSAVHVLTVSTCVIVSCCGVPVMEICPLFSVRLPAPVSSAELMNSSLFCCGRTGGDRERVLGDRQAGRQAGGLGLPANEWARRANSRLQRRLLGQVRRAGAGPISTAHAHLSHLRHQLCHRTKGLLLILRRRPTVVGRAEWRVAHGFSNLVFQLQIAPDLSSPGCAHSLDVMSSAAGADKNLRVGYNCGIHIGGAEQLAPRASGHTHDLDSDLRAGIWVGWASV